MDEDLGSAESPEIQDGEDGKERSVSADLIRGHINTIILRSLYDGDKYGYEIIAEIEAKSHGQYSLKQPTLYSALKRLEKDGYITSYWGGSVGGGRRKYFSLTDEGKAVSEQNQSEWEYSRTIIDSLISDRDFDFNNPAPAYVNMRVLRDTTSRVTSTHEGEEDFEVAFEEAERARADEEYRKRIEELEEEKKLIEESYAQKFAILEEEKRALEAERETYRSQAEQIAGDMVRAEAGNTDRIAELEAQNTALTDEKNRLETELGEREAEKVRLEEENAERVAEIEAQKNALEQERANFRSEMETREQSLASEREALEAALRTEREVHESSIAAREQLVEEEYKRCEALRAEQQKTLEEERAARAEEKERYEFLLSEKENRIAQEKQRCEQELAEQEKRIRAEMEEIFRRRELEIIHQNYMDLVNAPPAAPQEQTEFTYTAPQPASEPAPAPAQTENYRTVISRIYANAAAPAREPAEETVRARSLNGIDFRDLEQRAAEEGIRVTVTGGNDLVKKPSQESVVHRGKALFLSAVVLFAFCLALGAIALGVRAKAGIPLFFPYFIWGAGLAVLLATGLAYANHYGEHSVRRARPILVNVIVVYALLAIGTLIVALAVNGDFSSLSYISTFIIFPLLFFLGDLVFGVTYYLQVRPIEKK